MKKLTRSVSKRLSFSLPVFRLRGSPDVPRRLPEALSQQSHAFGMGRVATSPQTVMCTVGHPMFLLRHLGLLRVGHWGVASFHESGAPAGRLHRHPAAIKGKTRIGLNAGQQDHKGRKSRARECGKRLQLFALGGLATK